MAQSLWVELSGHFSSKIARILFNIELAQIRMSCAESLQPFSATYLWHKNASNKSWAQFLEVWKHFFSDRRRSFFVGVRPKKFRNGSDLFDINFNLMLKKRNPMPTPTMTTSATSMSTSTPTPMTTATLQNSRRPKKLFYQTQNPDPTETSEHRCFFLRNRLFKRLFICWLATALTH